MSMLMLTPFARPALPPTAPPTVPQSLSATFHDTVLTMEHAGQPGEPFWLSIFGDRYDHGVMAGFAGNHHPNSDAWDNSTRYYKVTGPATVEESVAVAWEQHVSAGDHTPVVPPVSGSNRDNSFPPTDNMPSLLFKATNAYVLFSQMVADIKAGEYIRGNVDKSGTGGEAIHYPQTESTNTYIDEDTLYTANIFNPRCAYCDALDLGVAFGANNGGGSYDTLMWKLRIYRRTTDTNKPYANNGEVYDFIGQMPWFDRSRNECAMLGTKFYVGGGEGSWQVGIVDDVYTILQAQHISEGAELCFFTFGTATGLTMNENGDEWGKFYYAINVVGDGVGTTFQISETPGGSPFIGVTDGNAALHTQCEMYYFELDPDGSGDPQTPELHYVSGNYANGSYDRWGQLIADTLNDRLIHIGKKVTVCDPANGHAWSDLDVPGFTARGFNNVQGWFNKKYNSCFFRGTLNSDTQASAQANSCYKFHSIAFAATPLALGQYTNLTYIDTEIEHKWNFLQGDYRNFSGTPGVAGTYQSESSPYGTLVATAAAALGTEFTSSDLKSMYPELKANPTFGITTRITVGDGGTRFARSTYDDLTQGPRIIITTADGDTEVIADYEWDFTISTPQADVFITHGGFHFVWPDIAYEDIISMVFKATKITSNIDTTLSFYLLAPHLPVVAPDSTEWGFDRVTTTTAPLTWPPSPVFADAAADMPTLGAAAGFGQGSDAPNDDPDITQWGTDPRVQPDHMGGATFKIIPAEQTHRANDSWATFPGPGSDRGVFTMGLEIGDDCGDVDRCKTHNVFSGNPTEFSDVGCAIVIYISKISSQNPLYMGLVQGIYPPPLTNSDNFYRNHNVQQMLMRRRVHYDIQVKMTPNGVVSGVGDNTANVQMVVDQVLTGDWTGFNTTLASDTTIGAYRNEFYHGGMAVATHTNTIRVNNYGYREGEDWIDQSLIEQRFGIAA